MRKMFLVNGEKKGIIMIIFFKLCLKLYGYERLKVVSYNYSESVVDKIKINLMVGILRNKIVLFLKKKVSFFCI